MTDELVAYSVRTTRGADAAPNTIVTDTDAMQTSEGWRALVYLHAHAQGTQTTVTLTVEQAAELEEQLKAAIDDAYRILNRCEETEEDESHV